MSMERSCTMTRGSDEVVSGDHALIDKRANTDEEAAGDGAANDDPMTEAAAAGNDNGKAKILNPVEEAAGAATAEQNFTVTAGNHALINKLTYPDVEEIHKPEEAAAKKKRPCLFDFDQPASVFSKYRYEQIRKCPVFLRQCQLLKAGKKLKKAMVPVNPEVAKAMLDLPRQDMSKFDELPEGFDDLPEVFRAAIIRGRDLAKKLVKEEDILEQFRTQGHAEVEAYVIE